MSSTGEQIGVLRDLGKRRHEARLSWPVDPGEVTVRSSLGGWDSTAVAAR